MILIAFWVLLALGAVAGLVHVTIGWGHDAWASDKTEGNIKTIQAIVLGLGFLGVVAGAVVTYRRQQTMQDQLEEDRRKLQLELDKFAQEQVKYTQEQVRETERRQQERYAQGAQMLADESPAVRIAGLNVIAALGREVAPDNELRQTCVNLICAYLRVSSPASPRQAQESEQGESLSDDHFRVVAAEACRLLPTLLEKIPPGDHPDAPPHALDLDLRQVNLIDLDLSGRYLGTLRCERARFSGVADFRQATFIGIASFGGSTFTETAQFEGATFIGNASFWVATFSYPAQFERVTFIGNVSFVGAAFEWDALFGEATFSGNALFGEATFSGAALFEGATFSGNAQFSGATFSRTAAFDGAVLAGNAWFDKATFSHTAAFSGATFSRAVFSDARFVRYTDPDGLGVDGFVAYGPLRSAVFGPEQSAETHGADVPAS